MYYKPNNQAIHKIKSKVFIAKRLAPTQDERLNIVENYEKPIKYYFNIQPVTQESEIKEFGQLVSAMKVAVITEKAKYEGKFEEFDLAYLDGANPDNEQKNGNNANYRIYAIKTQNTIIKVYFIKLVIDSQ